MQGRGISRRALFGAGAGLAATGAIGLRGAGSLGQVAEAQAAGAVAKRSLLPPERIGLQLYSLRDAVTEIGLPKVLETVAEIGFKQVEFAGYEEEAKEVRAMLDANGLVGAGAHVSPTDDASMEAILDDAQILGLPQVGLSLLTPNGAPTVSGWQAAAEQYNHYGQLSAKRGIGFYCHNHFQEWLPTVDNPTKRGIDVLLEETDPKLVFFQLDIFWAHVGRAQSITPFDPLRDYAIPLRDRFKIFHVKDGQPTTAQILDVGQGEIDFQEFFTELFKVAPDQHDKHLYMWERDSAGDHPRGPIASARASFASMRYGLFAPGTPGVTDCVAVPGFTASVLGTAIRRDARGRRTLRVTLKVGGPADVSARVTRGKRTLAATARRVDKGTRTIDLVLPRSATSGAAKLNLSVSNGAGVTLELRDSVSVPSARAKRG